jgi:hypothetical protein
MKIKKDLQSSEVQSLQTGELNESLSSSKDSLVEINWKNLQKPVWLYWTEYAANKFTADIWYQRLYRYFDVEGRDGHKWQRNLVKSMISFTPLPFIWVNALESINHIIDGGQRTRIIDGWFRNCIRLPKDTRIFFKGELLNLSEKNWRDIEKYHPEFAEYWKNNYCIDFKIGNNLSDEICAEQFEKLNDSNEMSKQEFRTCIISNLNKFVLDKSNYESKTSLKIFQRNNLIPDNKKSWISKKHNIPFAKRGFDAVIAKLFYLVMTDYSLPLKDKDITKMYYSEKEMESYNNDNPSNTTKTQLEKYKSKVNSVLKWIDELLINDDSKKGALSFSEIVLLLHTKFVLEKTNELKITDAKQFLDSYRRLIKSFKADDKKGWDTKKWQWKNHKGEPTSFSKSLSSVTTGYPQEVNDWRNIVANEFITMFNSKHSKNLGFILTLKKDTKRAFNNSLKAQMASVQDFKCMYYEYCGNEVDGIDEAIAGDHSSVSHSKGGETSIENGAACCTDCNREKSSLSHNEFLTVLKLRGLSDKDVNLINIRKSKIEEYATEIV